MKRIEDVKLALPPCQHTQTPKFGGCEIQSQYLKKCHEFLRALAMSSLNSRYKKWVSTHSLCGDNGM